jgi:hypothetical protein
MAAAADVSFAAIRARNRLGIAIAAIRRIMATTISSSISEKPFVCPSFHFAKCSPKLVFPVPG